ncbi:MAG: hypothetical protein L0H37_01425 [Nitrosospira sp.]|nr:hypothetical protein [Nitrosospira sp.]
MNTSLEEEKRALLERMHASRRNFRSRFVDEDEDEDAHDHADDADAFPRSHTFKFLTRHPYSSAAIGLLATLAVLPRGSLSRAVKGGAAIAVAVLGSQARALMMRQLLPSMMHLLKSHKPRLHKHRPYPSN